MQPKPKPQPKPKTTPKTTSSLKAASSPESVAAADSESDAPLKDEVGTGQTTEHPLDHESPPELSTAESLWNQACEVASQRGSDEALFTELQFDSGDIDRIRVRFKRPNTATAGFVQSNMDRVALILREAAGRRIAVELAAPAQPPDAPERASLDTGITENPLVREALELFDATIHSVRRLPPVRTDDDSPENASTGAQDDV